MDESKPKAKIPRTKRCYDFLQRNNTSFPEAITIKLRRALAKYREFNSGNISENFESHVARVLKYYQYLVRTVMVDPEYGIGVGTNSRGLLIYHKMGMGKSFLAVAVALATIDARRPIIIAPKSLHFNFATSVRRLLAMLLPDIAPEQAERTVQRFKYVAMDASNYAKTMSAPEFGGLDNALLIVDEAHNLFRAIINSADEKTNARQLYRMVMAARNLRLLFLTGTPSSKDPFELVPCFNMLAGGDLLPAHYDTFYRNYVDAAERRLRNVPWLANRLVGMVSYMGHDAGAVARMDGGLPEELPLIVERVEMSPEQYRAYLLARAKEASEGGKRDASNIKEKLLSVRITLALPGSERDKGSTYYVRSRSLSNFAAEDAEQKVIDLPDEAFTGLSSPKIVRMLDNLGSRPGPALVYSQFVHEGGLEVVARFLRKGGYVSWPDAGGRRYAVISGDVPVETRAQVQTAWNSPENRHGGVINALLVSRTGTEGLDLKHGRQVHILEPYWDKSREDQVRARLVRLGSHDDLPPEERDVQPYLYIAIANANVQAGIPADSREAATIDEVFHARGVAKAELNTRARELLQQVAIECALAGRSNCHTCRPTDRPLFGPSAEQDLRRPNPCHAVVEREMEVEVLVLDGKEYHFRRDAGRPGGVVFFAHDATLDAFVELPRSDPAYVRLMGLLSCVPEAGHACA